MPACLLRNEREGTLFPDRVEVGLGGDVNDIVGYHCTAVDGSREFDGVDGLELFSGGKDVEFAVFGSDPDFAVGDEG